jgi:UDP-glucose 4-epimerase
MILKSLFIQNVVSNLACEAMISDYCNSFDISSVLVILANIIGPVDTHGVIYEFIVKMTQLIPHNLIS